MVALFLVALLLVSCSDDGGSGAGSTAVVPEPPRSPALAYVTAERLVVDGREHELAAAVAPALAGTLTPAAVPAPSRQRFVYTASAGTRSAVRTFALDGADTVVDEPAYSVAWRADGALGYVRTAAGEVADPRATRGQVVVRPNADADASEWTAAPARFVVAAWADEQLLVYRLRRGHPELVVLSGSRRERSLGSSGLVAVSPDGRRIVVSDFGAAPPRVRLLDVDNGRELASLQFPRSRWVAHAGSWVGETVVAAADAGVLVLRVQAASIELVETVRVTGDRPRILIEPQLVEDGIVAWGELESRPGEAVPQAALVAYDRARRTWRTLDTSSSLTPPRPVYNPSR